MLENFEDALTIALILVLIRFELNMLIYCYRVLEEARL
jgi:hypothetical protein